MLNVMHICASDAFSIPGTATATSFPSEMVLNQVSLPRLVMMH